MRHNSDLKPVVCSIGASITDGAKHHAPLVPRTRLGGDAHTRSRDRLRGGQRCRRQLDAALFDPETGVGNTVEMDLADDSTLEPGAGWETANVKTPPLSSLTPVTSSGR